MTVLAIATTVLSVLSPYLQKAGQKVAEMIGEELYPTIKRLFIIPEEEVALENFKKDPSAGNREKVKGILIQKLSDEKNEKELNEIKNTLKLTDSKAFNIEILVEQIEKAREDIEFFSLGENEVDETARGNWKMKVLSKQKHLKDLEARLLKTLND